jgi:hypothetical protein
MKPGERQASAEKELARRRNDALRRALAMPPKQHKPSGEAQRLEGLIEEVQALRAEITGLRRDAFPSDQRGHSRPRGRP